VKRASPSLEKITEFIVSRGPHGAPKDGVVSSSLSLSLPLSSSFPLSSFGRNCEKLREQIGGYGNAGIDVRVAPSMTRENARERERKRERKEVRSASKPRRGSRAPRFDEQFFLKHLSPSGRKRRMLHFSAIFPSGESASRVIDADNRRQKNVGRDVSCVLRGVLRPPCPAANDNNYEASGRARAEERERCGLQPRARILRLGARRRAARINIIAGDRRQNETATTASAAMTR